MAPLSGRNEADKSDAQKWRNSASLSTVLLGSLCAAALQGCISSDISIPAPVLDHSIGKSNYKDPRANVSARPPASPVSVPVESPNRPGYYTVKPGDTIYHISLDHGQNWKDLAKWNNVDNPNVIEAGRVLRVVPPEAVVTTEGVVVRPVNSQNNPTTSTGTMTSVGTSSGPQPPSSLATTPTPSTPAPIAAPSGTPTTTPATSPTLTSNSSNSDNTGETPNFIWPSVGKVIATFDESKNKGVDISGKLGDPVLASADGKVVYSGSGLRGYGNLLIIKHNNTYLSAYAHNQTILVKEDQNVKQGQKIAEVGNSDAEQAELHFEIRKYGKPVDPLKWLPAR
jgi:lipoprotein NlpD